MPDRLWNVFTKRDEELETLCRERLEHAKTVLAEASQVTHEQLERGGRELPPVDVEVLLLGISVLQRILGALEPGELGSELPLRLGTPGNLTATRTCVGLVIDQRARRVKGRPCMVGVEHVTDSGERLEAIETEALVRNHQRELPVGF